MAFQLVASSKKGMSAHQLHRMLDITYKSAWFLGHRIRHVMKQTPFGGKLGGIVEADETYIGGKSRGLGPSLTKCLYSRSSSVAAMFVHSRCLSLHR